MGDTVTGVIETALAGEVIKRLVDWVTKSGKDKENTGIVLLSLKAQLRTLLTHFKLCKQYGHIMTNQVKIYLPGDIEMLDKWLSLHQQQLGNELYDSLYKYVDYLLEYNEFINSMGMGQGQKLDEYHKNIINGADALVNKIDELIKE